MHKTIHRALALLVGVTALVFGGWAGADPPSRAARVGYLSGAVSFSPAGEDDWVQATINRPLTVVTASGRIRARGPKSRSAEQWSA